MQMLQLKPHFFEDFTGSDLGLFNATIFLLGGECR